MPSDENTKLLAEKLLANLSPEMISRIDALFGAKLKAKPGEASLKQSSTDERRYFLITRGHFQCIVSERDAPTLELAIQEAESSLTPWYYDRTFNGGEQTVATILHKEFVDWLRR